MLPGDDILGDERGVANHLPLKLGEFRRLLVDLGGGLVAGDRVGPLVDREQRLALRHPLAVGEVHLRDKPRNPRSDVDLRDGRGIAREDDILGHVTGDRPSNPHLRRR